MTITLDTGDLKRATALCARILPLHPVLGAVHIHFHDGTTTFTASNMETTIEETIDADTSGTDARILIGGRSLANIAGRAPGATVKLEPTDNGVAITSGRWRAKLPTIPAAEFDPYLPASSDTEPATIDGAAFMAALAAVAHSTHTDRAQLSGVHLMPDDGGARLVATDSYRLATRRLSGLTIDQAATIPNAAVAMLQAAHTDGDPVTLATTANRARLTTGTTTITTSTLAGTFPTWTAVIPAATPVGNLLIDDPADLLAAVQRNGRLFGGQLGLIHLTLDADGCEVEASETDVGEGTEPVAATWDGPTLTVTFNSGFLADGLNSFTGPVTAAIVDELKPVVLRGAGEADPTDLYIIVPVRRS